MGDVGQVALDLPLAVIRQLDPFQGARQVALRDLGSNSGGAGRHRASFNEAMRHACQEDGKRGL